MKIKDMESIEKNLQLAAFEGFLSPNTIKLSIKGIKEIVSLITNINESLLTNCSRKREVVRSRQYVVIFSQFVKPTPSLSMVGEYLNKGHATILSAKRRAKGLIEVKDSFIVVYLDEIRNSLGITKDEFEERLKNIN
jgi:chromosomal replication initiation ATPase DnaA